jgi:hypothetical protein
MVHMLLVPPPYKVCDVAASRQIITNASSSLCVVWKKVEEIMRQSLEDWDIDSGADKLMDYDEFNRCLLPPIHLSGS